MSARQAFVPQRAASRADYKTPDPSPSNVHANAQASDDLQLNVKQAFGNAKDKAHVPQSAFSALLGRGKNRNSTSNTGPTGVNENSSTNSDETNIHQHPRLTGTRENLRTFKLDGIIRPDMAPIIEDSDIAVSRLQSSSGKSMNSFSFPRQQQNPRISSPGLTNRSFKVPGSGSMLSVSGMQEGHAHISTHGAVSGFMTASRVSVSTPNANGPEISVMAPIPSYADGLVNSSSPVLCPGSGTGAGQETTIRRDQSFSPTVANSMAFQGDPRARSGRSLERINEDSEAELQAEHRHEYQRHDDPLSFYHTNGHDEDNMNPPQPQSQMQSQTHAPTLRRAKRVHPMHESDRYGGEVQEDDSIEINYGVPYKRYRVDDGLRGRERETEFDEIERQNRLLPSANEHQQAEPRHVQRREHSEPVSRGYLFQGLGSKFADMGEMDPAEAEAIRKRWENCTHEEWMKGADEIAADIQGLFKMVKDHMASKMSLYASLSQKIATHKDAVQAKTEKLKEMKQSIAGDLMSMTANRALR
ncbi:hypothetical protein BJ138DRAFT_1182255 [Hygrophoropsis aurantiaca]|uniref:Uncharacterized protein n=1 Tax=Hygrophoropsis aurantiaca TaxID=72124 RepID=A0ACB8A380_9AGAM|nr:hypothetical protein BJ138DRAFT_1182255 [Hygrophoropsis aurantiaca]